MTTASKPVTRETFSCYRGKPLVLTIHPTFITIRQKGCQTKYAVTVDQIWTLGARNAAEALRREREEKRKTAKLSRSRQKP